MDKNKIREALEIGLNYVMNSGYSRYKDDEKMEITEALAELDIDDWIKVTPETMPLGGSFVLIYTNTGNIGTAFYLGGGRWSGTGSAYIITHWQPLPSNPNE